MKLKIMLLPAALACAAIFMRPRKPKFARGGVVPANDKTYVVGEQGCTTYLPHHIANKFKELSKAFKSNPAENWHYIYLRVDTEGDGIYETKQALNDADYAKLIGDGSYSIRFSK